ncbi:MAG: dipeptidase [Anaerolineae bacterium]|nr:dipeptidase [Anaerolineae bacterium]
MNPQEYAVQHQQRFLDELKTLLAIPSISTLASHKDDIRRAAEWLTGQFSDLGFETELYETDGHPIVFARWLHAGENAPTVLVYGHYDVQPVEPLSEWRTPPFEPTVVDDKLYARGAADDKGQVFAHLKAVEALLRTQGELPVNVKFIIEGEEENGSTHLHPFIESHVDLLAADVVLVSDTHSRSLEQPTIVYALRGMSYMEIEVFGADHDLHSGTYGGVVHNPAQALCEIIAQLHDTNGTITVPGFYDRVRALGEEEREELRKLPYTETELQHETGAGAAWGEAEYDLHERTGARPTLEVNGLISGWTGEGAKTVLPARALAKVSCRLVADQDPVEIYELVKAHIARLTPPTVRSEVRLLHYGSAVIVDRHSPVMQAAIDAYQEGWGYAPVFTREGGSIPIVADFQAHLGAPIVLMGFGLPDDGLHAPNEKFTLECLWRGIATSISFFQKVAQQQSLV